MSEVFLKIVNMSISAGWLVLAVLLLRLVLKKAPRWIHVLLWGIVAVRLICPFSIESALSLIPSSETISPEIMMDRTPEISTGIASLDRVVNPVISTSFAPEPIASANPLQILIPVSANLWLLGVLVMLAYTVISYLRLKKRVSTAFPIGQNIRQSEFVDSPFVLGLIRPVIYLPFRMDSADMEPVIAHELTHIRRKDHWWKPAGFALLAVHWFNPLMWVAYILLCRDIELACDEQVIAGLDSESRANYTQALVASSVNRRTIAACPLAFGEVGVKERVKSIMNYRKPGFWIIVAALFVCLTVAICFLTDPRDPSREGVLHLGLNAEIIEIDYDNQIMYVTDKDRDSAVFGDRCAVDCDFAARRNNLMYVAYGDPNDVRTIDFSVFEVGDSVIIGMYTSEKEQAINGYAVAEQVQLATQRLGDLHPMVTEWASFATSNMDWDTGLFETTVPAFPGVTFRCTAAQMTAEDQTGEHTLIQGMPIWNVFFTDLTGDGKPEICATVSFGSGMIDTHVVVYDYANGQEYTLWDRGIFDYSLRLEKGVLLCEQFSYPSGTPHDEIGFLAAGPLILVDVGGGAGKRLTINSADVKEHIVSIVDRTVTEQLPTDEAIEVFYEDEQYTYSFASIRSHLVVVTYYDGSTEEIRTALATGRASISDLDRFGIHYYAEPKVIPMEPTRTNLRGLVAGYLFVPINGATYRYRLTDLNPADVTADKLLDACTEETPIEGIVWDVWSLKEYPDMTRLLIISGTNSAWLCEYAPAGQAEEGALEAAREAGYVVEENGQLTSGADALEAFYQAAQKGTPAFVHVAHYYTLDPDRTAPDTYEAYKQDYPALYIHELSFDGEVFVLRTEEDVRVYEYLMKYTVSGTPSLSSSKHEVIDRYVLTHDNTHTWDQLWSSLMSSAMGVAIEHHTVCKVNH